MNWLSNPDLEYEVLNSFYSGYFSSSHLPWREGLIWATPDPLDLYMSFLGQRFDSQNLSAFSYTVQIYWLPNVGYPIPKTVQLVPFPERTPIYTLMVGRCDKRLPTMNSVPVATQWFHCLQVIIISIITHTKNCPTAQRQHFIPGKHFTLRILLLKH